MNGRVATVAEASSLVSGIGLVLVPKCPLCFAAYGSALGALALHDGRGLMLARGVFGALVLLSMALVGYLSWKRREPLAALLGAAGVLALGLGELDSMPNARLVGATLVTIAAWYNAWRCRQRKTAPERAAPVTEGE